MNTIHHTDVPTGQPVTGTDTAATAPPGTPQREPIWRVVGGSVAAGFLGALVLTLGVFGGAAEHVITGCALLAFAGGWAMLALLSTRFTSQPQRWARVPAIAMAFAAVTLLIAQPNDRALNTAGWFWPPLAMALAVWMFVQLRRSLHGRVRWLLYPVVGSIALGAVGGTYETFITVHDHHTYAAPGVLYEVGGHRLHMNCTGTGTPTVVLENGLGETSPGWARITSAVSGTTRVCAYDRAGQGWSDDVGSRQDADAIAVDLHTLLARSGETGPYVLVGHSAGGPYVMTFAAKYPDEVAGMVLLDSMSPYEFTDLPGFTGEQSMMRRGLGVLPSLARLGITQLLPASAWSGLPEPEASQVQVFASSPRGMRNMLDEQSMYPTVFEQARALTSLGDKPLVVVTATESIHQHKEWIELQDRLAALSSNSQHRVADATHSGVVDDSTSYMASLQAITDVVQSVRTGQPVNVR
jgi:pimeloyl-ACP methyl ester carboxylesterase